LIQKRGVLTQTEHEAILDEAFSVLLSQKHDSVDQQLVRVKG